MSKSTTLCNCASTVTALALTPSWSRVRRELITDQTAALRFTHGRNELRLPS